jgi:hypothetical protein
MSKSKGCDLLVRLKARELGGCTTDFFPYLQVTMRHATSTR